MMRLFRRSTAIPAITVHEASERVASGELLLVDVRAPGEVAAGGVPGALEIPLGELGERVAELRLHHPVAFICRSGVRSARATRAALNAGYDAVNVEGGVAAWERAGLPLTNDGKDVA